ncbi:MAG TPA: hypothetical protein PLK82_02355 [Bacteroidales bacterium]|nr:hypothetical protein [Bacteroidales bacterium]
MAPVFSIGQIAMAMNIDREEFIAWCDISEDDPEYKPGHPRYHYDKGRLQADWDIAKGTLKRAKDGNQTSIQQFTRYQQQKELEKVKQTVLSRSRRKTLVTAESLALDPGNALSLIKADVQQVEFIRELFASYNSKNQIISRIRKRWNKMGELEAERLFNEVLNFYYLTNDEVKLDAWRNILAERMDDLFHICVKTNDFETARRCLADLAEIKGVNKDKPQQVPPEILDRRPIIYSLRISDFGMLPANRNELASMIDGLDISEKDKTRLRREAMIEDVPFELSEDEEN